MPLLASTSGQRNFSNTKSSKKTASESDTDTEEARVPASIDNSLKIWKHSLF